VLHLYNWEDYLGETTLADFERETGIQTKLETYPDEDVMLSSIQSDPSRYDLFVASGDLAREMIQAKLVAPLEARSLSNWGNLAERFQNLPYDPGNRYAVPYMWGTTGLAVNRKRVKEQTISWSLLWNPRYKGRIALLNNGHEVLGGALKYLGYPLNSANEAELARARDLLIRQQPLIVGYLDPETIKQKLISGEIWIAQAYSGDAAFAREENPEVDYVIPREGAAMWIDMFLIPRSAPHKAEALAFLDYVLRPEVSGKIANYLCYANPNEAARPYTDREILEDPAIYPPPEVIAKCEFLENLGSAVYLYNRFWAEVRAAQP
jgi:spermidine/putrescine-binding protein